MFVLDTDTLSRVHAGNEKLVGRIREAGERNTVTTVVTAIEVLRGRQDYVLKAADGAQLLKAQELLRCSQELLKEIPIVEINADVAAVFDRLRNHKKLRKIGRADLLIACCVLAYDAILVTRNLRHFAHVPLLRFENWLD